MASHLLRTRQLTTARRVGRQEGYQSDTGQALASVFSEHPSCVREAWRYDDSHRGLAGGGRAPYDGHGVSKTNLLFLFPKTSFPLSLHDKQYRPCTHAALPPPMRTTMHMHIASPAETRAPLPCLEALLAHSDRASLLCGVCAARMCVPSRSCAALCCHSFQCTHLPFGPLRARPSNARGGPASAARSPVVCTCTARDGTSSNTHTWGPAG